jgi:hypothetical protein
VADGIDLVCSGATVTKEREREADFCSLHLNLALAVVKREGITGDSSIKGLRIGVRRGTTAEHYAKHHEAPEPSQISESNEKLYASLAAGELDAVIDGYPIAKYFSQSVTGLQFAGVLKGMEEPTRLWSERGTIQCRRRLTERSETWRRTELSKDFVSSGLALAKLRRVNDRPNLAWQNEGVRCGRICRLSLQIRHSRLPSDHWQ